MKRISLFVLIGCFIIPGFMLEGCGGDKSSTPDGAKLYADNCQSCHGALASSSKRGATAAMIHNAISNNTGGMGRFSSLSDAQIQAIASALQ